MFRNGNSISQTNVNTSLSCTSPNETSSSRHEIDDPIDLVCLSPGAGNSANNGTATFSQNTLAGCSSQTDNETTDRSVRPMVTVIRCSTRSTLSKNVAQQRQDDEDDLICLSPDAEFFCHNPQSDQEYDQKMDTFSGHIEYETKVQIKNISSIH